MASDKGSGEWFGAHVRWLYLGTDVFRADLLKVMLLMDVADGHRNMFHSGSHAIGLDDVNGGLAVFKAANRIKKFDSHEFKNLSDALKHFGSGVEGSHFRVSGVSGNARLLSNFPLDDDAKEHKEDAGCRSPVSNSSCMVSINEEFESIANEFLIELSVAVVTSQGVSSFERCAARAHDGSM